MLSFDTMKEITQYANENIEIPKYKTLDICNYDKFVGGMITNHFQQGSKAGEIANILLDNKKPKDKLINGSEVNAYIFNYDILKKYGIDEARLPESSYIKDKPLPFWEKYSEIIIPGGIVLASLVITILVLLVDMIRRKEYEKEILKAKEMAENTNRVQSDFISNISHELRTPVAVIMSSNRLLDRNLSKLDENTRNKSINSTRIIKQNCYRLLRIVNNIIDIAKIDSGFMNLRVKNVEMISLLEYLTQSVVPYAKSKNIEVVFDTEKEEIITAVDPDKIERIVLNLLSNAIKFSKENGKISMNVYVRKEKLFFIVEDNGIGMDESNLEKIFNKFIQIEGTLRRNNEGSGIGLSLVKSFVELHDGSVYVDSKLNEGSKFTVSLPIRVIENEEFYTYSIESNGEGTIGANVELSDIIY